MVFNFSAPLIFFLVANGSFVQDWYAAKLDHGQFVLYSPKGCVLPVLLAFGGHNPLLTALRSVMRSCFLQAYPRPIFGVYLFAGVAGSAPFLISASL